VKQQDEETLYLCKSSDEQKDAPLLGRKAPQGRRSLWHIFEAMQLKGLLHGSSRRKQAEALRLHNLKEKECQEVKEQRRSQSLPPRLSSSPVSKDLPDHILSVPDVFPRALMEVQKGSSLEHGQANGDEESWLVVKPVVVRSMSCKAPAATLAPSTQPGEVVSGKTDAARKYHPDEDTTPKTISR